uniref:Uncharacterized protein n=1 Tax=Avena sativa TaxID=4498 RepID=A0ACD5XXY5_AVESA
MEVDDDVDDEDMYVKQFLREGSPSGTSSSLTSEAECEETSFRNQPSTEVHGNKNRADSALPQKRISARGMCKENVPESTPTMLYCESGEGHVNGLGKVPLQAEASFSPSVLNSHPLLVEASEEDAISRRTQARCSLTNYALEELETFLQESDDDGDLRNVDEEEEYRKFLASLLSGGCDDTEACHDGTAVVEGFTYEQLGQLHMMIYAHAQLMIQTFSLSVLDPCKQSVAADVKTMIIELVGYREQALARSFRHQYCFERQHLQSVLHASTESSQCQWIPLIRNPVMSILDVPPLHLALRYLSDVEASVVKHRKSLVDGTEEKILSRKEPLFPSRRLSTGKDANNVSEDRSNNLSTASPASSGQLHPKKTLAATLIDSTKKETVALVPFDIARLAQRFYPLFNFFLFPRKPPPAAVVQRVLFTDAEDGLLAPGILEYNSDWGEIQKRFLPCKSTHQIFVRHKNRTTCNAPDNPVKEVRRMKVSPLSTEEIQRIEEGLKIFKNDWTSVWKFVVPHRDPAHLQRQWRVATGVQRSYSKSDAVKERRRLNGAKRRKLKASVPDSRVNHGQEADNNASEGVENDDDSFVNEASLADAENRSINMTQRGTSPDDQCGTLDELQASHLCKEKGRHVVKLAPDLPPVNLAPSVCVTSQMELHQKVAHFNGTSDNAANDLFPVPPPIFTECVYTQLNFFPNHSTSNRSQQHGMCNGNAIEDGAEQDFPMHPLLFQHPREVLSSYSHPGENLIRHDIEQPSKEEMHGIVMEQEELSDSEEDSEHVEFECEEIDDSEEEQVQDAEPCLTENKGTAKSGVCAEFRESNDHCQIQQGLEQVVKQGASLTHKSHGSSSARSGRPKLKPEQVKPTGTRRSLRLSALRTGT